MENQLCKSMINKREQFQNTAKDLTLLMGAADYGDKKELAKIRDNEKDNSNRISNLIRTNRCE